jgi:fructose-1,6-bisphosphatase/inositol monophosphatase family enzyme
VNDDTLLQLLHDTASAVADRLDGVTDWGLSGTRRGQHHSDLAADDAALAVLGRAPVGVLSEESGLRDGDRDLVVVVDPLDGSTNAHRGLPWYATSLCAVDRDGPRAAVVNNLLTSERFTATRGGGATRDGSAIGPSACARLDDAIVGLSGWPPRHMGWAQFRVLGAVALDLCAVASGTLDGFVDCSVDAHCPWDYLGALLICRESGVPVVDAAGRELVVLDHGARRTPIAGASAPLLEQLVQERRHWPVESVNASSG